MRSIHQLIRLILLTITLLPSAKACAADLMAQWIHRAAEKRRENIIGGDTKNPNRNLSLNQEQNKVEDTKQTNIIQRSIDYRRAAVFFLYGGLYQGMAQEYIYNDIYSQLFGVGTDLLTASKKVGAEMFVLTPLLCIPAAYVIKGLMGGGNVKGAIGKYWEDVVKKKILFMNWSKFYYR